MKAQNRTHQGWALPTVMAVLGLGALAGLSLARGVWLHASLLRSDGDEWRARGAAEALLRLEIATELPTPAEHISARRMLQLQLLTRRNDPAPTETWVKDVAQVLASAHNAAAAMGKK